MLQTGADSVVGFDIRKKVEMEKEQEDRIKWMGRQEVCQKRREVLRTKTKWGYLISIIEKISNVKYCWEGLSEE